MISKKTPSKTAIKEQLQKILGSNDFQRSARISDFLKFIVTKTLEGKERELKGYTIGIEVFKKPDDFDPDSDASVRVEASRLRKALALYYFQEGKNDPVEISIPKGSYVPDFKLHEHNHVPMAEEISIFPLSYQRLKARPFAYLLIALFSFFLLTIALSFVDHFYHEHGHYDAYSDEYIPTIAILNLNVIGEAETRTIASEFTNNLTQKLRHFKNIHVKKEEKQRFSDLALQEDKDKKYKANYVIEGSLQQQAGKIRLLLSLVDAKNNINVWSFDESFDFTQASKNDPLSEISSQIVSLLASPYGIIYNIERERVSSIKSNDLLAYQCVFTFYSYSSSKSEGGHIKSKKCLEEAVSRYPNRAELWSYLSWVYGDELRYGYNREGNKEEIIERTVKAARKAVDLNPESAKAHQYLSIANSLDGRADLSLYHTARSVELNPYDSDVLVDAAWQYGKAGQWEKSKEMAQRAIALNPSHPKWYHGTVFGYYYMKGDYENALIEALEYYQPDVLLSQVALAVSYAGVSRYEEAQAVISDIEKRWPDFYKNPEEPLKIWGFKDDFVDKLLIGLKAAGLKQH